MEGEVAFLDAEFQTSGSDKIDFKTILMKQIDYIRFLRVQDMGENAIFDLGLTDLGRGERFFIWTTNSQKYQNSVKSLKTLLINYQDAQYNNDLKKIEKKYNLKINSQIQEFKQKCFAEKKKEQDFLEGVKVIKRGFNLLESNNKFDEIFEVTLQLAQRAKFIGGNDLIEETA